MDREKKSPPDRIGAGVVDLLEQGDRYLYVATGLAFLVVAVLVLVYGIVHFVTLARINFLQAITVLIHDLLLVLIIMEILRTIHHYLVSRAVLLEPFLHIGIIAAIRRILMAGAEASIKPSADERMIFYYFMDIGVSAAVVLALAVSVYLFNRRRGPADD
jgi:uncharacterized membrane protein (DUF373 family)